MVFFLNGVEKQKKTVALGMVSTDEMATVWEQEEKAKSTHHDKQSPVTRPGDLFRVGENGDDTDVVEVVDRREREFYQMKNAVEQIMEYKVQQR